MGWESLLSSEKKSESMVYPWTGGRRVRAGGRTFLLSGKLPERPCWISLEVSGGRNARFSVVDDSVVLSDVAWFERTLRGYAIGERFVSLDVQARFDPTSPFEGTEPLHLVEEGLARFTMVRAGRWEDGRLVYVGLEMPMGAELEVTESYQRRERDVAAKPGVTPALRLAFLVESWQRDEEERILRLEEEARLARLAEEARRVERERLAKAIGTPEGRRELAKTDFGAAAKAALAEAGAEMVDWRKSGVRGFERIVTFRFMGRSFECTCHAETLRIIDAGICLTDHATGVRGDDRFTLESFPAVIAQAIRERKLVVWRHGHDGEE